jgi:hypothetical protein
MTKRANCSGMQKRSEKSSLQILGTKILNLRNNLEHLTVHEIIILK